MRNNHARSLANVWMVLALMTLSLPLPGCFDSEMQMGYTGSTGSLSTNGAEEVTTESCAAYTIQFNRNQSQSGTSGSSSNAPVSVTLSFPNGGSASLYKDTNCTQGLSKAQLPNSSKPLTIYIQDKVSETVTLKAVLSNGATRSTQIRFVPAQKPTNQLSLILPSNSPVGHAFNAVNQCLGPLA